MTEHNTTRDEARRNESREADVAPPPVVPRYRVQLHAEDRNGLGQLVEVVYEPEVGRIYRETRRIIRTTFRPAHAEIAHVVASLAMRIERNVQRDYL